MSKHLLQDLDFLQKEIINIASMPKQATSKALLALLNRRVKLAKEVIDEDEIIDRKEVQIEEECLKVLALHQPVATDLRFIIAVIKVNNDLERIGDLAVNIAERATYLARHDPLQISLDFPEMADAVSKMLHRSLDALAKADIVLAREVLAMDDAVDAANRTAFVRLQELMYKNPETIKRAVHLMSVSRHLERIGDLATNIAEEVVYMVEGEIIRHADSFHHAEDYGDEE